MTLKGLIDSTAGLREMADGIEILSAPGRNALLSQPFLTDAAEIRSTLADVESVKETVFDPENKRGVDALCHVLMCLNDITSTLRRLADGCVLDDVELFEVKTMAMNAMNVRKHAEALGVTAVTIPDVDGAVEILDPDHTGIPHFFIYNSYSIELTQVRKMMKATDPDSPEGTELFARASEIEDRIRVDIARRLRPFAETLLKALNALGALDLIIAKSRLAEKLNLAKPEISESGETIYRGLFNPAVAAMLQRDGGRFQPVDITVSPGTCLIIGANMGGKSLTLKSLALAQTLAQLAFFVPAASAVIVPVERIAVCMGDAQDEMSGLSSFAAEMLRISDVLKMTREHPDSLVLIDEPARTTNPEEGRAIANAILSTFDNDRTRCVVTSHYSGLHARRRLRVRGLAADAGKTEVSPGDLAGMMDYSLIPSDEGETPHEALRIASMIGVDPQLIDAAKMQTTNLQQNDIYAGKQTRS